MEVFSEHLGQTLGIITRELVFPAFIAVVLTGIIQVRNAVDIVICAYCAIQNKAGEGFCLTCGAASCSDLTGM